MSATKPTFVVFVGAFHLKESLHFLLSKLEAEGYATHSETLKSVDNAEMSVADDVEQMRGILVPLFEQNKDVVFVIHSYAEIPGSAAIKGLSKAQRSSEGLPGGIVGVVYLCAFVAPEGASLKDMIGGDWTPWQTPDHDTNLLLVHEPKAVFYNDVPEPLATESVEIIKPHSIKSMEHKSPPVGYKDAGYEGRLAYIRGEYDAAIPCAAQDAMREASGVKFIVERFETGHSPFLSHPDLLTKALVGLSGQFQAA